MSTQTEIQDALAHLEQQERTSRRRTLIATGAPLLIAGVAFAVLALGIMEANRDIQMKQDQLDELQNRKSTLIVETGQAQQVHDGLVTDVAALRQELEDLRVERRQLSEQVKLHENVHASTRSGLEKLAATPELAAREKMASALPITAFAEPKASATPIPGREGLYEFKVWLDVSDSRRHEIAAVSYLFDHPTFQNKQQVSRRASDDFAVSYRGWGALSYVVVTVELRNGEKEKMPFDMLAALGWQQAASR